LDSKYTEVATDFYKFTVYQQQEDTMINEDKSKVEKFFTTINILFFALLSGQTIYFFIGLFLIQSGNVKEVPGLNSIFMFITPVIVLSSFLASRFIYTKQVTDFDKSSSLEIKLVSYRTNNIIRFALLEGANIFNITIMIITVNYFFAALFIIIIVLFFLDRPTKEKFIVDYEISSDDSLKILE
jgi:hypothetical protein